MPPWGLITLTALTIGNYAVTPTEWKFAYYVDGGPSLTWGGPYMGIDLKGSEYDADTVIITGKIGYTETIPLRVKRTLFAVAASGGGLYNAIKGFGGSIKKETQGPVTYEYQDTSGGFSVNAGQLGGYWDTVKSSLTKYKRRVII